MIDHITLGLIEIAQDAARAQYIASDAFHLLRVQFRHWQFT
jgi:hypothetical protein